MSENTWLGRSKLGGGIDSTFSSSTMISPEVRNEGRLQQVKVDQ
jgi:hypothetical protein